MNKQQGFTLIELIMVIVILGILAATALPRFMNLQVDAKIASLEGMQAAIISGANLVHSKALIDGVAANDNSEWVDINDDGLQSNIAGGDVRVRFLYPQQNNNGLANLVDMTGFTRVNREFRLDGVNNCEVLYTQAANQGDVPLVTIVSTAC